MAGLTLENAEEYEKLGSNQTYGETLANVLELTEPARAHARQAYALMTDPNARQQFATNLTAPLNQQDVERAKGVASNFGPSNLTLAGAPLLAGMTAYHGTPHVFEPHPENPLGKFSLEKIGTGEGAQAYGHGIYVAENSVIANSYKDALAWSKVYVDGKPLSINDGRVRYEAAMNIASQGYESALKTAKENVINKFLTKSGRERSANLAKEIQKLKSVKIEEKRSGNLYHVDVPDTHVEKMLDWDKPLSEQHPELTRIGKELSKDLKGPFEVRKASGDGKYYLVDSEGEWGTQAFSTKEEASKQAGKMRTQQAFASPLNTGQSFYEMLSNRLGGDEKASAFLKQKGIPGIKYLDAGSRGLGQGSRNLVLFDPEIANITKRE